MSHKRSAIWEEQLDQAIENSRTELIQLRRHLHRFPELSGSEFETTKFIVKWLSDRNFGAHVVESGRGLWSDFGVGPGEETNDRHLGRRIGLRADIDALPIQDVKVCDYSSTHDSIMHACGHDAHTSIVCGAMLGLKSLGGSFEPSHQFGVRAIFQPAEETCEGSQEMLAAGATDGLSGLFATHVDPCRPVGSIGWRTGELTANCDDINVTVRGRGGHGARPHQTDDPVTAAALLIVNLQTLMNRSIDTQDPAVVSFGVIHGGSSSNVIPSEVQLQGTIRTLKEGIRNQTLEQVRRVAEGVAEMSGCQIEIELGVSGPAVVNNEGLTYLLKEAGERLLGESNVNHIDRPSMGSEDFAFYSDRLPISMIRVGCCSANVGHHPLHTPAFDVDEEAIINGAKILARAAVLWAESSR